MSVEIIDGIMGLCIADALGVPVEFQSRESLQKDPVVDMRSYGTYNQPAGTWSDDSSLTLCLVDSLAKGLNYDDIITKFVRWFNDGDYTPFGEAFDIGNGTRNALVRYETGTTALNCGGITEYDNGNGSLMRILPIAFYLRYTYGSNFYEIDEAYDIIHNVSALTHDHKRSKIACGIYITIAGLLLERKHLNIAIRDGIDCAMEYYRNHDEFAEELYNYERLERQDFRNLPIDEIRSSGYVVSTLEAAIWCLLKTISYEDCVLKAVNLGKDTDTVAAVAGGLAGLHYGYDAIPKEWLNIIQKKEYIQKLCENLKKIYI